MKLRPFKYKVYRVKYAHLTTLKRNYSTSCLPSSLPLPIKVFDRLDNNDIVLSYRELLKNKAGIYCFVNTVNGKRYVGSAKDLYIRLIEHLSNKKSNIALKMLC